MSGVLDQNEEVIDVAYRLSSLSYFLEAVRSLSRLLQSAPPNLPARQKKVITLVEVARRTLLRAGVVLHTFAACPPHLEGHKRAYLELLTHLNAIKPTVTPDALRGKFLQAISSWLTLISHLTR
ncbi:hypothetical protein PUNSTDRAFT_137949 [Punctularia strigosozonata HHB-11173 SS5]|uniref:Uncharacterized protein n=1 Tax=Punctularia strigosozonata (strain HHB-11173) TaxID=741275 RepID=R7S5I3_PUNST|nr:uncharacterized protein PUNSTDRAFT_137949 [Punctularia strigosozonata HHB-11173 SS5]EIN05264.1 hypothetical protein PUNSTDRAFT_137949 [Punctularia strigosozonata HHB-11173 SS5]